MSTLPNIIRQGGPYRTRFGIRLNHLKPYHQRVILDNPLIKESSGDDQFIQILFRIADMEKSYKGLDKFYYNPYTEKISKYVKVLEDSEIIDWDCAICRSEIKSQMFDFQIKNFVCRTCGQAHHKKNRNIDSRILDSSLKFRKHVEKLLKKQQDQYLRYVKKFGWVDQK